MTGNTTYLLKKTGTYLIYKKKEKQGINLPRSKAYYKSDLLYRYYFR